MVLAEPKWYGINPFTIPETIQAQKATSGLHLALIFNQKQLRTDFGNVFHKKKFVKVDQPRLKTHIKCSQGREDSVDIKIFPFGPGIRGQSCTNVKIRFLKKLCDIFSKISNLF